MINPYSHSSHSYAAATAVPTVTRGWKLAEVVMLQTERFIVSRAMATCLDCMDMGLEGLAASLLSLRGEGRSRQSIIIHSSSEDIHSNHRF